MFYMGIIISIKILMQPLLVESNIKNIMNKQLIHCKNDKFIKNSTILNITLFVLLCGLISFILFIKYKGKQNIADRINRENIKKKYILSKLQVFQKMKTNNYTNIPM